MAIPFKKTVAVFSMFFCAPFAKGNLRGAQEHHTSELQRRLQSNAFDRRDRHERTDSPGNRQGPLNCVLGSNGLFGNDVGDPFELSFLYEVYVDSSTPSAVLRSRIMPGLDKSIAETLLPTFFNCLPTVPDRRRRLQTGTIEAISSLRPDEVAFGLSCAGDIPAGEACYVVQGYVSVFGMGFLNSAEVGELVVPEVRRVLKSEKLLEANPMLRGVVALNNDLTPFDPDFTRAPVDLVPSSPVPVEPSANQPTVPTSTVPTTLTVAPSLAPDSTGTATPAAPTGLVPISITAGPTGGPSTQPTRDPLSPTMTPTGSSAPSGSAAPTQIPVPTLRPTGPAPTPTDLAPQSVGTRSTPSFIQEREWWEFLLVAIGVVLLLTLLCACTRKAEGDQTSRRKRSDDDDNQAAAVGGPNNVVRPKKSAVAQQGDNYQPPGPENIEPLGTFTITPSHNRYIDENNIEEDDDEDEESSEEEESDDEEEDIQYYEDEDDEDEDSDEDEDEDDVQQAEYSTEGLGYEVATPSVQEYNMNFEESTPYGTPVESSMDDYENEPPVEYDDDDDDDDDIDDDDDDYGVNQGYGDEQEDPDYNADNYLDAAEDEAYDEDDYGGAGQGEYDNEQSVDYGDDDDVDYGDQDDDDYGDQDNDGDYDDQDEGEYDDQDDDNYDNEGEGDYDDQDGDYGDQDDGNYDDQDEGDFDDNDQDEYDDGDQEGYDDGYDDDEDGQSDDYQEGDEQGYDDDERSGSYVEEVSYYEEQSESQGQDGWEKDYQVKGGSL